MAGRGPAPKDPTRRARRNAEPEPQTLLRFEQAEPHELPAWPGEGDWPQRTREWWQIWRDSSQAEHFSTADWDFLLGTAFLHARLWGGEMSAAPELRPPLRRGGSALPRRAQMSWSGHWHGYGPWVGASKIYGQEGGRRPPHSNGPPSVLNPEDKKQQQVLDRYREAAAEFQTGNVPPTMTGHWLLKKNQASADRTWADLGIALAWLAKQYEANPPFERTDGLQAYSGFDIKLEYALDVLPRGVDVSWVYYMPSKNLISFPVVCCPNRFHPQIPCPLPPS